MNASKKEKKMKKSKSESFDQPACELQFIISYYGDIYTDNQCKNPFANEVNGAVCGLR